MPALYNATMSYQCLADFLKELGLAGELMRVEVEVDPRFEAAEIARRVAKSEGPALLFGSVRAHEIPLLTNLLASQDRICRALGVRSLDEVRQRIDDLLNPAEPEGWFERIRTTPARKALGKVMPRIVRSGECQQVVKLGADVDLYWLPAVQASLEEEHRTIASAQVYSADADSTLSVSGCYDLQILDQNRLAVCWTKHQRMARVLEGYRSKNEHMPVAVALGGDPVTTLAAMAPLPTKVDVRAFAGFLREKAVDLVACRTVPLEVPAEVEIVLEGVIDPKGEQVDPGPMCTPMGRLGRIGPVPVLNVTAITHRANPIYPAVVAGSPPNEAVVVARAMQRICLPMLRMAVPELVDCDLPTFGAARHWIFVSIRKRYAAQARRVANAIWGQHTTMFGKVMVIVDEDVDLSDKEQVLTKIATNVCPGRDIFFAEGPPDPWDPVVSGRLMGQRVAIDATTKLPDEQREVTARSVEVDEEIRQLVDDRWFEYGFSE